MVMSRTLRASLGGLSTHAKYGSDFIAARARRGFDARFERQARENAARDLSPEELRKAAEQLKRKHFKELAHRSAEARRARSAMKSTVRTKAAA
jgi:hypothetical protein